MKTAQCPSAGAPDAFDAMEAQVRRAERARRRKRHLSAPCPKTSPWVDIVRFERGAQVLRFSHCDTPQNAARPYGAAALQLFVVTGPEPAASPAGARLVGEYGRNPVRIEFGAEDDRKIATYFGRWLGHDGEVGPWSTPVSLRIAS